MRLRYGKQRRIYGFVSALKYMIKAEKTRNLTMEERKTEVGKGNHSTTLVSIVNILIKS